MPVAVSTLLEQPRQKNLRINISSLSEYFMKYLWNTHFFNDLLTKFPSKIVGKKKSYDSKNLYSFSKEEFFEILKKDKIKKDA